MSPAKNFLCIAAFLASVPACSHIPPPIVSFGVCVNQAISGQVNAIITEVETDLASEQYLSLLTDLGKRVGWTVVDCAVQEVLGASQAKHESAPSDALSATKVAHAKAWLARGGTAMEREGASMEIAILNESSKLTTTDLAFIAAAVDYQMREHVAPAWGMEPWPVSAYTALPAAADQLHPLFIMDSIGVPDALGDHNDVAGFIFERVLPPADPTDATVVSHECAEAFVNPTCNLFEPMPGGRQIAREVGDPVEATGYPVQVTIDGVTRTIMVSNFVLPSFFQAGSKGPWDYMQQLSGPFAMLGGGYEIIEDASGTVSDVFAHGDRLRARLLAFKHADPRSRTSRIHALRAGLKRGTPAGDVRPGAG